MKRNKGITLVALIVTIIVLLILAGVSISSLTGSGLFGQAQKAAQAQRQAEIDEKIRLLLAEVILDKLGNATIDDFLEKLKQNEMISDSDIQREEGKAIIIVEDEFIYEITIGDDGLIKIEYIGTKEELQEGLEDKFSIEVTSTTVKTITVKVASTYSNVRSEIKEYKYSRDNGQTWEATNQTGEYTFDNIYGDVGGVTCNIKVQVVDNLGNTTETSVSATTSKNTEYYCDTADKLICNLDGREYWKYNNEGAIVGVGFFSVPQGELMGPILVSTSYDAVTYYASFDYSTLESIGSITYNGVKYYYSSDEHWMYAGSYTTEFKTINLPDEAFVGESVDVALASAAKKILDIYYGIVPTFTVSKTKANDTYTFNVQNIKLNNEESTNAKISYKLHEETNWVTNGTNISFEISEPGLYDIKVEDTLGNSTTVQDYIYVEDGLLLHLDGENNTRAGHNANSTVWEDLSGNNNDAIGYNIGTETGYYSEAEKGYVFLENSSYFKTTNNIGISGDDNFTIDCVMNIYGATDIVWVSPLSFGVGSDEWYSGGAVCVNYWTSEKFLAVDFINNIMATENTYENIYNKKNAFSWRKLRGGVVKEGDTDFVDISFNGNKATAKYIEGLNTEITCNVVDSQAEIGRGWQYGNENRTLNGAIQNIRIYNRTLTDEEAAINYQIDKFRFNLE